MIALEVDPQSVEAVDEYFEATRQRILTGIREGMQEAMEGLAALVAQKVAGSPIHSRTGKLLAAILGGVHVRSNANAIVGEVRPDTHDGRNLALWLEKGVNEPGVVGKLMRFVADGALRFAYSHRAFRIEGRPFMNPSLEEDKTTIMEIIERRIANAIVE